MSSKRHPSALRAAHQFLNDCKRCITAHSLAMFLPQIGDSVQQVQLADASARRLDLDEAAHCDP